MAKVRFARHLHRFFPGLAEKTEIEVAAATAAEVVRAVNTLHPGFADYIVDERGSLRPHVNLFVGDAMVVDRVALSDKVGPSTIVSIMQALSGG